MKRREMLTSLAAGVAGAIAAPAASAQESHAHADAAQAAAGQAPAADQTPRLLDEHRRKMLEGLAEQLVPGSRSAGVTDLLDRVVAVEPANAQRRFLNALGAFDREARDRHAKAWLEIAADQQIEILRAASTLAPSRPPAPGWKRGDPVDRPAAPAASANLRDHFDHLRDWVQRAYFTTPAGMKELGFSGRMAFPAFPGCPHPGNDHR